MTNTELTWFNKIWAGGNRLLLQQQIARRRYFICMEAVLFWAISRSTDRIMRLLASYSQCTVIGIDYPLSPEARFPQAIEEIVAACCYFHQQAEGCRSICPALALPVIPPVLLALASALWLRDKRSIAVKLRVFCCGMGFTDYGIP